MKRIHMKKIAVIILAIMLMFNGNLSMTVQAKTTDSKKVIKISSEKDLKNIAKDLTANYVLTKDIKLSGKEWTSIGTTDINDKSGYFKGTLDGAGHTISNFYSTKGQGLFGTLAESAVIKNLTLSGNMVANNKDSALLAYYSEGSIINCTTTGSVKP